MTPLTTQALARQRQRDLLDAADHYRLRRKLRRPAYAPTRWAILALVWMAEVLAYRLDRMAARARRSGEIDPDVYRAGGAGPRDRPAGAVPPAGWIRLG